MRKKLFCAVLTAALLAMQVVPVSAASTLPVTNANKYTVSVTGGGSYEYTVPFTGNFEITLAGSQGSTGGGPGYVVTTTRRFSYGDRIKFVTYRAPGNTSSSVAGKSSRMYLNGTEILRAGGGTGGYSYSMCNKNVQVSAPVTIAGGEGGSNGSVTYHTCSVSPNQPCYTQVAHSHSHAKGCASHQCGSHDGSCGHGHQAGSGLEGVDSGESGYCHHTIWDCNKKWDYPHTCGHNSGDQLSYIAATPGTCYGATGSLSNRDSGSFTICLAEHYNLYHHGGQVSGDVTYRGSTMNLVLRDNYVVYYKRR